MKNKHVDYIRRMTTTIIINFSITNSTEQSEKSHGTPRFTDPPIHRPQHSHAQYHKHTATTAPTTTASQLPRHSLCAFIMTITTMKIIVFKFKLYFSYLHSLLLLFLFVYPSYFQLSTIFISICPYAIIQYKHEYYYSGINPVKFRSHIPHFHLFSLSTSICQLI